MAVDTTLFLTVISGAQRQAETQRTTEWQGRNSTARPDQRLQGTLYRTKASKDLQRNELRGFYFRVNCASSTRNQHQGLVARLDSTTSSFTQPIFNRYVPRIRILDLSVVFIHVQWTKQNNKSCPKYLFVAWIGKHFDGGNVKDRQRLHELARYATKEAGLPCYWISLNCRSEDPQKKILDVSLF